MSQTTRSQYVEQVAALLEEVNEMELRLTAATELAAVGRRVMNMSKMTRLDGTPAQMNYWRGYNACLDLAQGNRQFEQKS